MWSWNHLAPGWLLFLIFIAVAIGFGALGVWLLRGRAKQLSEAEPKWLDLITHTITVTGTLYALLLVLTALQVYGTYSQASLAVATEAAELNALHSVVSEYPEPTRSKLQGELREYVDFMANEAWPAYRRGDNVEGDRRLAEQLSNTLLSFEPSSEREQRLNSLALAEFNKLSEARQIRHTFATAALPTTLWFTLLFGAAIIIILSCFIPTRTRRASLVLVCAVASMIALLIFIIERVDNPFRGSMNVSAGPYVEAGKNMR
ncbi:DUF4239 domain-containing protein [Salinispora arenicola]|uniref:bestrophin-like domain n=1 Tax=Salinispora arenicola TaxID=168697 RepID=UPI0003706CDA|nr:DUF4239 domain-containing protein [Salinispora arenicola]